MVWYNFFMSELKTRENDGSIKDFIDSVDNVTRKKDANSLLSIFNEVTGYKPKLWGTSIIGYGKYHYKSERSKQEGDWPLTGFSPRKTALTIYIMTGFGEYGDLIKKIGKCKTSSSCLYVNKLEDIDIEILKKLIKKSVAKMKEDHGVKN